MNAFSLRVSRGLLAALWLFGALQLSESKIVCQAEPEDPKIVVFGVNSSTVRLIWQSCIGDAGEIFNSFIFKRQKPDDVTPQQIASRGASDGGFTMDDPFKDFKKYRAFREQELRIFNVQINDEYVYTLSINYRTGGGVYKDLIFQVTVLVKVPPEITTAPRREIQLSLNSATQNYTLRCNASGDPHPSISWTKDGIPASQFNASGYSLHLVDVQKTDAGSYRCTASNGYGSDATSVGIVNIRCTDCTTERVGITIREMDYKQPFSNEASIEFKNLESKLLSAIWGAYADNPGKKLHRVDVDEFRSGSVYAVVELAFGPSVSDPLKPLRDEMNDRKLGSFTVDRELDVNPTTPPATESTETTTGEPKGTPSTGARKSGLSTSALWGIIGGCIAFVLLVGIIILICCITRKKSKNSGASKSKQGGKSKYSEADGYRMNRQPPPSGLGTASPAYVEARQYAPVTAARRQDDQSKPLNYADLSFNNSSGPGRQPPPYSGTEYSEMSPEKRPPPAGGQQGEGGGFELWC